MLNVMINDGVVHINGSKNLVDVMTDFALLTRAIYDCEKFSEKDREIFKKFVKEELGNYASLTEEEMKQETENNFKQAVKEALAGLPKETLDNILKIFDEVCS